MNRLLDSLQESQHTFSSNGYVAELCRDLNTFGEIQVNSGTEADQAVATATLQRVAILWVRNNPSCNQAGNLHAKDFQTGLCFEKQARLFVFKAGLIQRGVEKTALVVKLIDHFAVDRHTIDMNIEHVHENADLGHLFTAKIAVFRDFTDENNLTIRRRDEDIVFLIGYWAITLVRSAPVWSHIHQQEKAAKEEQKRLEIIENDGIPTTETTPAE